MKFYEYKYNKRYEPTRTLRLYTYTLMTIEPNTHNTDATRHVEVSIIESNMTKLIIGNLLGGRSLMTNENVKNLEQDIR